MNITRQQQILSLIKRVVSTELSQLNHEAFHSIVITHILLSNSGREARVYVAARPVQIAALNTKFHSQIQKRFMKKFARKVVPNLIFVGDDHETEQLEALLESSKK